MKHNFFFFPEKPVIQFVWIGAPNTIYIDEANIDTLGPSQLADALMQDNLDQFVVFYCLDEYVIHFERIFTSYSNLVVRSIDLLFDFLILRGSDDFLKEAKYIFDNDKLGDVRQRVDAKNLASLMLLYLQGGYYLDTTIFPSGETLNFPAHECFMVPLLSEDYSNRLIRYCNENGDEYILPFFEENDGSPESQFVQLLDGYQRKSKITSHPMVDVFAMYSPKNGLGVAQAIKAYVQFYPILENIRKIGTTDEIANTAAALIDSAINHGYFGSNPSKKWLTPYAVDEEGLVKRILKKWVVIKYLVEAMLQKSCRVLLLELV